jgi:hypothetical protein
VGLESKTGGSQARFAAYVDAITSILGHAVSILLRGLAAFGRSEERRTDGGTC